MSHVFNMPLSDNDVILQVFGFLFDSMYASTYHFQYVCELLPRVNHSGKQLQQASITLLIIAIF